MAPPDKERLQRNMHLAQQLGASIETFYGDDVAYQIAEFSRLVRSHKDCTGTQRDSASAAVSQDLVNRAAD